MRALFRVFPYLASADPAEPGGALYIPPQGGGRVDNPGRYAVLYLGDSATGAVAEAFGRFSEWTPAMLDGSPSLPGSVRAIARYGIADDVPVCNLDDPRQLLDLGLRPSQVVSRDYDVTRAWARLIHGRSAWRGVQWWSYYNPAWSSFGLWDTACLELETVKPLRLTDDVVRDAARTIVRLVAKPGFGAGGRRRAKA